MNIVIGSIIRQWVLNPDFLDLPTYHIEPFNDQCSHYIETSQLIRGANKLTVFYIMGILVFKGLIKNML